MTIPDEKLLTRDEFREAVFRRDGHKCVICYDATKIDAHHIMERRLFHDGGYYLSNGATLCDSRCHTMAEQTVYTCEDIRERAGITRVILPSHLYRDERYDKWGNPYLPTGMRIRGELFYDESVQKVLKPFICNGFTPYVKYPRTWHLPYSPGVTKDDRVMPQGFSEGTHVVVTEKMDGENTTMYNDYIHARSIDYSPHLSRSRVKAIWASIAHDIPEGYRVCGENLYAKHSIEYNDLTGYFQVFSVWDDQNVCLPWSETVEWAGLLGLPMVRPLYIGKYDDYTMKRLAESVVRGGGEGVVIRESGAFSYAEFSKRVGKYVRQNHVQTHGHWMRNVVVPNKLKEDN